MKRIAATAHEYLLMVWLAGRALTIFLAGLGVFEITRTSKVSERASTPRNRDTVSRSGAGSSPGPGQP
jgi:hypothetical protein